MLRQPPFLTPGIHVVGETWMMPTLQYEGQPPLPILDPTSPPILLRAHPTPSVCVALFRPGTSGIDILLHLRADNGLWGLPGGALEDGESIEHAVRREMEEETGLAGFEVRGIVSMHSDPATGALFTYPDGNTVHYVCVTVLAWMADWEASAAGLRASAESLALYWFPYEASHASLPEPFSPIHQRRLETAWECLTCPMTAPLLLLG